jgi:stage II sporulation protein P
MSEIKNKTPVNHKFPVWFFYGTIGIFLMLLGIFSVIFGQSSSRKLQCLNRSIIAANHRFHLDTQTSRYILQFGIPILERSNGEDDPFTILNLNWSEIFWRLAANIREANPLEILKTQIPLLALTPPQKIPVKQYPPKDFSDKISNTTPNPLVEDSMPVPPDEPLVFIYHTHTSESYIPVSGKDHVYPRGDIVSLGKYLQQVLEEKYNIKTIHSEEIHDQIPFRESYQRSQVTIKKYLNEYPSIKVVLDVHRDAAPGVNARCMINEKSTATIGIIVGSDKMGLPHPNWRKNYQFASKLAENMNLYYPGLNSRVLTAECRYNQHLHDHALIIEIGDQNSTLEEVYRAAELFGGILAITLNGGAEKGAVKIK